MRVIIASDFAEPNGGAAKVAIDGALGLAEAGLKVTFLHAIDAASPALDHPGIERRSIGLSDVWSRGGAEGALAAIWNREAAARVAAALADLPHDTPIQIHQWTKAFSPSLFAVCAAREAPTLITLHDYFAACPTGLFYRFDRDEICALEPMSVRCWAASCDRANRAHKLVRLARQGLSDRAVERIGRLGFVHVSDAARRVAARHLPSHAKHFTVPNPVMIRPGARVAPDATKPFLYLGRFAREKGIGVLAEAARRAGVPVLFVGAGPDEAVIRNAHPRAEIRGWVPPEALPDLFASVRALVFPSLWHETFGLVVAEARAAGLPVIATNCTPAIDLIEPGSDGILVEPGDVDGLAAALRRLGEDPLIQAMGKRAHARHWADPPSLERHIERLIAAFEAMTGRRVEAAAA